MDLLLMLSAIAVVAAIAIPQSFNHDRVSNACTSLFEFAQDSIDLREPDDCRTSTNAAIECLSRQQIDNPRNRAQRALTTNQASPCQVHVQADGDDTLVFTQIPAHGKPARTFSVALHRD